MTNQLLKAEDVAKILNISIPMVYLLMQRGDIRVVHIGRLRRVRQEDLDNYVNAQISQKITGLTLSRKTGLTNQ